jgi:thiamine biosynthesis lipoprotein
MRPAANTSDAPRTLRRAGTLLAAVLLGLAGCQRSEPPRRETLHAFGTSVEIELRDATPEQAQSALAEITELLSQREREWHAWEASELTRINAELASGKAAKAPDSVLALIERALPLVAASDGLFDPAVGGLVGAWGFHTSSYPVLTPPPGDDWLAQWRRHRPSLSQLTVTGSELRSSNPRLQLDFGAVAEGVAAEEVMALLVRHRIRHALVSLGGDVVALGDGDGAPWQVGLRDPFGGMLGGVALADGEAFFSTGNYSKFRESPTGARWSHILDPRTGRPARGAAAVAVLHADPVLADAAATALFVAGPAGFERLARAMRLGCALMVTEENEMLVTTAMKARLELARDPISLGAPLDLGPDCRGR